MRYIALVVWTTYEFKMKTKIKIPKGWMLVKVGSTIRSGDVWPANDQYDTPCNASFSIGQRLAKRDGALLRRIKPTKKGKKK